MLELTFKRTADSEMHWRARHAKAIRRWSCVEFAYERAKQMALVQL